VLNWTNPSQQGEIAGNHQPLDMMGISVISGVADSLCNTKQTGICRPVKFRQWPIRI